MLHKIFFDENGIVNEILKGIIREEQGKAQYNPFLQPIEAGIKRLENMEKQIKNRLEALAQLHRFISEIFTPPRPEKTAPDKDSVSAGKPAEPKAPEPEAASEPMPRNVRKKRKKAKTGFKRLSKHRATGNARLDSLEMALHDALECLNNTKLAFYVKTIKHVRIALNELNQSWDKPENERLAELESGLKDAVDKLSANSRAEKSKVMQNIWSDIIIALQEDQRNG